MFSKIWSHLQLNKLVLVVSLLSLSLLVTPLATSAFTALYPTEEITFDPGNKLEKNSRLGNTGPVETASLIVNLLLGLLGILSLSLMFYAGYLYFAAQGKEEDMNKAKDIIIGTIIGIVVVLASYGFMNYVFRSIFNTTDAHIYQFDL